MPGAPTILIVDDDLFLLRFAGKYLTRVGYQVAERQGAQEAWALFEQAPRQHVLAFVDATMADGSAEELAVRMLRTNPDLKVVFWSGYPFDPARVANHFPDRVEFLLKPFTTAMLISVVKRLTADGQPPAES